MFGSKLLSQEYYVSMFAEVLGRLNIFVGLLGDLFVCVFFFYVVIFSIILGYSNC